MSRLLFCHGLESGPRGSKFKALSAAGFDVEAPDFRGLNLNERVVKLKNLLLGKPPAVIVGSSYGGAVAACVAMALPVKALVLCAPALGRDEAPINKLVWENGPPTTVIHGTLDDVCAIEHSRELAQHEEVSLVTTEDGHRLGNSLELIVEATRAYLEGS